MPTHWVLTLWAGLSIVLFGAVLLALRGAGVSLDAKTLLLLSLPVTALAAWPAARAARMGHRKTPFTLRKACGLGLIVLGVLSTVGGAFIMVSVPGVTGMTRLWSTLEGFAAILGVAFVGAGLAMAFGR